MQLFEFMVDDLLDLQTAEEVTRPFWPDLTGIWVSAHEEWQKFPEEGRARIMETPSAMPGTLNALAQSYARERLSHRESDGLVPCDAIPGVFGVYVQGRVLVRFNGFDRNFVVRNTGKSELKAAYFRQDPVRGIDGRATRLTVGYQLDASRTELATVAISLQVGEDPVYRFFIDGSEQGMVQMPTPTVAPAPERPTDSIRHSNPR